MNHAKPLGDLSRFQTSRIFSFHVDTSEDLQSLMWTGELPGA
jgi:hypothetical protein